MYRKEADCFCFLASVFRRTITIPNYFSPPPPFSRRASEKKEIFQRLREKKSKARTPPTPRCRVLPMRFLRNPSNRPGYRAISERTPTPAPRSEEHTSELQSQFH